MKKIPLNSNKAQIPALDRKQLALLDQNYPFQFKYWLTTDECGSLMDLMARTTQSVDSTIGSALAYRIDFFDTVGHQHYLNHHNGKSVRQRFSRTSIRGAKGSIAHLKHKCKQGRKVSISYKELSTDQKENDEEASSWFNEKDSAYSYAKQVSVEFNRNLFCDHNHLDLLLLDQDLVFSNEDQLASTEDILCLKVLQKQLNRQSPLHQMFKTCGLRPAYLNKYNLSMALLRPELKQNRYKATTKRFQSKIKFHGVS